MRWVSVSSQVTREMDKRKGLKLHHKRFTLDARKNVFTQRVGTDCPGKWLSLHPWRCVDVTLRNMV